MRVHEHYHCCGIVRLSKLFGFQTAGGGLQGLTLFNHIFYARGAGEVPARVRGHERVHVHQNFRSRRHLVFGLPLYAARYLRARLRGVPAQQAYRQLPDEIEAYEREEWGFYAPGRFDQLFERGEARRLAPEQVAALHEEEARGSVGRSPGAPV